MDVDSKSSSGPYRQLNELAHEFAERVRRGESPTVQQYVDQYPELASDIRALFPQLIRLEIAEAELHRDTATVGPEPALRQVGDFVIVREIGRGGMGVVYEAEQTTLGRRVALKVLPRDASFDASAMERFRREARTAARLHHTNIVPVFEVGHEANVFFYAMQYIRGQSLDAVIRELKRLHAGLATRPASVAVPVSPLFGPISEGQVIGEVTESLLTGRFARAVDDSEGSNESSVETRQTVATGFAGSKARTGQNEREGMTDSTRSWTPGYRQHESRVGRELKQRESTSTILPGGSDISTVPPGNHSYFEGVARIGQQVAQALAYAHDRDVLHRDIKPSNLLLDTEGTVWITDFGLAKSGDDALTQTGDVIGTLRYMAPERFRSEGDERADIYALGLTLYELMTLQPAFDSADRPRLIERIQSDEPTRPRKLDARIPRDLETIVLKAIDKEPQKRYATAEELAQDLRRFLDGEPIRARQVSDFEKAWKWIRRRPALAAAVAMLAASLMIGTGVSLLFALRAHENSGRANERATAALMAQNQARLAQDRAELAEQSASLQAAGLSLDRGIDLADQGDVGAGLLWMVEALRAAPHDATPLRAVIGENIAAWGRRLARVRWMFPTVSRSHNIVVSPDGQRVALSSIDGAVRVYDADSGKFVGQLAGGAQDKTHSEEVFASPIAYSNDGAFLIVAHEDAIQRYDSKTLKAVGLPLQGLGSVGHRTKTLCMRPDGRELFALCDNPGPIHFFDAVTGTFLRNSNPRSAPNNACYLSDGRVFTIRFVDDSTAVELLDPTGEIRLAGPHVHSNQNGDRYAQAFWPSLDGSSYWCRARPGWLQKYAMDDGKPIGPLVKHGALRGPDVSAGGAWLPGGCGLFIHEHSNTITFLQAEPPSVAAFRTSSSGLYDLDPDARWFAAVTELAATRRDFGDDWPGIVEQESDPRAERLGYRSALYTQDRKTTLLGPVPLGENVAVIALRDSETNSPIGASIRFRHDEFSLRHPLEVSPDGRIAAAANGTAIRVFDTATGQCIGAPLQHIQTVGALAFSPDGTTLAAGDYSQAVHFWDVRTGHLARPPLHQPDIPLSLDYRPDGKVLAVGTASNRSGQPVAILWDLSTNKQLSKPVKHEGFVHVAFSPDGSAILSSDGQRVRFIDATTGELIGAPLSFAGEGLAGGMHAFSPDARHVLIGSKLGRARRIDVATATLERGNTYSHPENVEVTALAIAPDGQHALIGHADGLARLWDMETANPVGPPVRCGRRIIGVTFSPDGRTAFATTARGFSHRWPVPLPIKSDDLDVLLLRTERDTAQRLDDGKSVVLLSAAEWRNREERLAMLGDAIAPLAARVESGEWHTSRAELAVNADATGAALWHLERCAALQPKDWTVLARMGARHADAGRFDRAEEACARAEILATAGELDSWYQHCAEESMASGRYEIARWYLDRALARDPRNARSLADRAAVRKLLGDAPGGMADLRIAAALADDPELQVALGLRLAEAREWNQAATQFVRAMNAGRLPYPKRPHVALTLLQAGDRAAFHDFVARILGEIPPVQNSPLVLWINAWPALLGPIPDNQAARLAVALDQAVVSLRHRGVAPQRFMQMLVLSSGAAFVRAGRHAEAIARLEEGVAAGGGYASPQDDAFLALAHYALDHRGEAQRHLRKLFEAKPTGDFWQDIEIIQLQREVDATIRLDPAFPDNSFVRE